VVRAQAGAALLVQGHDAAQGQRRERADSVASR
jgi:hypothetical protein